MTTDGMVLKRRDLRNGYLTEHVMDCIAMPGEKALIRPIPWMITDALAAQKRQSS